MTSARANATVALLQDRRVPIAGGDNAGAPNNTLETYDPASGNFSFAGYAFFTAHAACHVRSARWTGFDRRCVQGSNARLPAT